MKGSVVSKKVFLIIGLFPLDPIRYPFANSSSAILRFSHQFSALFFSFR